MWLLCKAASFCFLRVFLRSFGKKETGNAMAIRNLQNVGKFEGSVSSFCFYGKSQMILAIITLSNDNMVAPADNFEVSFNCGLCLAGHM